MKKEKPCGCAVTVETTTEEIIPEACQSTQDDTILALSESADRLMKEEKK